MSIRFTEQCSIAGNVWTRENRISSDAQTETVCLEGLPGGAREPSGAIVNVDGKTKLNGIFKYDPLIPGSRVTIDAFDQVQLYRTLHDVLKHLTSLGFDIMSPVYSRRGASFKITGHANGTTALNAWYSPQTGEMTFGTNDEKWHLASDSDISAHEEGHLIFDHLNPALSGWNVREAGAIHEAFGDVVAAGYFNDPEMSEDFTPFKGRPESKEDGLRNVDNSLTLSQVSSEVHDRGQVYAAFFWAIKKELQNPEGAFRLSGQEAADLMLKLLVNHSSNYTTSKPYPKDFVNAVIYGLAGLAREEKLGVNPNALVSTIVTEALKRQIIKSPEEIRPPVIEFSSVRDVEAYLKNRGMDAVFVKTHASAFIGGTFEIYEQQIFTQLGPVEVEGGVIFIQKDRDGRILSLSTENILKDGPINDDGSLKLSDALNRAIKYAEGYQRKTYTDLARFRFRGKPLDLKTLSTLQTEHEISRLDMMQLLKFRSILGTGRQPASKLVIIDESLVPHYELKVGYSIYYVNTVNGEVTRKSDIKID